MLIVFSMILFTVEVHMEHGACLYAKLFEFVRIRKKFRTKSRTSEFKEQKIVFFLNSICGK